MKDLEILKRIILEADEETEETTVDSETTQVKEKPKNAAFEKDPMGFILKKYHTLNEIMTELMTKDFREFVDAIFYIAPKPTTFKIQLHNGQSFFMTYMKENIYEAIISGKRYYLAGIGEKERCMMAIARLLRFGTPLKTKGAEGAEEGTRDAENTGMEGDWAANGGAGGETTPEAGGETASADEGGEELAENKRILEQILIKKISNYNVLSEGGKSGEVRYNSEIGLLCGILGVNAKTFNPKKPEASIPKNRLQNPDQVYEGIKKFLAPNYDSQMFSRWVELGKKYYPFMNDKATELKTIIKIFGWVAGSNISETGSPVDIDFIKSKIDGVSIKDEGGITLANITPKSVGLEPSKGEDVFRYLAPSEYDNAKAQIFKKVMDIAKSQPNKPLSPISSKYSIVYDSKKKTYTCTGKKNFEGNEEDILSNIKNNSPWQRVFGDWFQTNYSSNSKITKPMYDKAAKQIESTIKKSLGDGNKLSTTMRFGKSPYFYATPKSLYYIPAMKDINPLKLIDVVYTSSEGTSQRFIAKVASGDNENTAEVDIYIRYANGMFETNPTVRIQSLKRPENIGWEKLV